MNLFRKKNKILITIDSSDCEDPAKLKGLLGEFTSLKDNEIRITVNSLPMNASFQILEILLSFSLHIRNQGAHAVWFISKQWAEFLQSLGCIDLLGDWQIKELSNG